MRVESRAELYNFFHEIKYEGFSLYVLRIYFYSQVKYTNVQVKNKII